MKKLIRKLRFEFHCWRARRHNDPKVVLTYKEESAQLLKQLKKGALL